MSFSKYLKNIEKLDLRYTFICDSGVSEFLKSYNATRLKYLDISYNFEKITDLSLKGLEESNTMKK